MNVKNDLKIVIKEIDLVTDLLYKQEIKTAYEKLNTLLISLSNVIDTIYQLDQNNNLGLDINGLISKLSEALGAMESGDVVLLADILQYEIGSNLNEIANKL